MIQPPVACWILVSENRNMTDVEIIAKRAIMMTAAGKELAPDNPELLTTTAGQGEPEEMTDDKIAEGVAKAVAKEKDRSLEELEASIFPVPPGGAFRGEFRPVPRQLADDWRLLRKCAFWSLGAMLAVLVLALVLQGGMGILLLLVVSVFGNTLNIFITGHVKFLKPVADWLIERRAVITPVVMMGFSLLIYKFLPNRKDTFRRQIPGSVFTAVAWMVISWVFSVYVDIFRGFSDMYGSLTTIVLIMLWLYCCMYSILLGGELNKLTADKMFS